jgi:hypothetical protein
MYLHHEQPFSTSISAYIFQFLDELLKEASLVQHKKGSINSGHSKVQQVYMSANLTRSKTGSSMHDKMLAISYY